MFEMISWRENEPEGIKLMKLKMKLESDDNKFTDSLQINKFEQLLSWCSVQFKKLEQQEKKTLKAWVA